VIVFVFEDAVVKNNAISLLDFTIKINKDGSLEHDFYQKKAKANLLPHFRSAIPTNFKKTVLINEIKRREERCSSPTNSTAHRINFENTMTANGYPTNFLKQTNKRSPQKLTQKHTPANKFIYFNVPYINDKIDRQISNIFREINLPVRLYRRSYTLRNALRPKQNTEICQTRNCPLNNLLCHRKNCVYQITCTKCKQIYIGSTIRPLHTRIKEHLTLKTSSVLTHHKQCQAELTYNILATDNDAIKLRFKEAMLIHKHNASINNRAEREELQTLIF
jgi:GIY-YIG catalytic domain